MEGEPQITWMEMTDVLREAAKELGKGEMLHADSFNLGDSMSALEMMDPKMDAGLLNPDVVPADDCFEKGLIPLNPDTETVVALIDRLSALEMTWLRGSAIVQTIFTSIHCHRPAAIEHDTLRIYCQALLKCCDVTKRAVSKASVYEEEDFSTNIGGYSLCEEIPDEEVTASLTAQEEVLSQRAKTLKQRRAAGDNDGEEGGGGGGSAAGSTEEEWLEALLARVRLRRAYLSTLQHLSKGFKGVKAARKSLAWAQSQLALANASRAYDPARVGCHSIQAELNMKMMAPSPPRAVRILSVFDAMTELARSLQHLDSLCQRVTAVSDLAQLQTFAAAFTALSPAPGVVARSFLRLLVCPDSKGDQIAGGQPLATWVRQSMAAYLIPEEVLAKAEAVIFVQRCSKLVLSFCSTLCYNQGRQRRRLVHAMEDWAQVQIQAERMDQFSFLVQDENGKSTLSSASGAFFSGWLLDQILGVVTRFLELGFLLHLHAPFELSMIYWYWDYLLGVRINCQPTFFFPSSRAYQEMQAKKDRAAAAAKSNKKKGKADKGSEKPKKMEPSREHLLLEAQQALCRGMFRLVAGLEKQGLYFVDPLSAASIPLRFHRRFSPMMRLEQPSALTFEHYLDSTDASPYPPADLLAAAADSFAEARALCDRVTHKLRDKEVGVLEDDLLVTVRGLLRVASYNHALCSALQARVVHADSSPDPDPATLPALPPLPEPHKPEARPLPGSDADLAESALGGTLACDAPLIVMSPFIAFDFSESPSFPCVVVTT